MPDRQGQRAKPARPPRTPSRGRGFARYEALLDATDELLRDANPDDVGLYQIAAKAGVPAASIYHFFPTPEAAFTALARRFADALMAVHRQPIDARDITGWQALMRIDFARAMAFTNQTPSFAKIFYGGFGGVEARQVDHLLTGKLAEAQFARMDRIFKMPVLSDPAQFFATRLSILDGIWSISIRRHGLITPELFEESCRACVAYTRLWFPEDLVPRERLVEATRRGEALVLALDDDDKRPAV